MRLVRVRSRPGILGTQLETWAPPSTSIAWRIALVATSRRVSEFGQAGNSRRTWSAFTIGVWTGILSGGDLPIVIQKNAPARRSRRIPSPCRCARCSFKSQFADRSVS
jgi:hypothetical protein